MRTLKIILLVPGIAIFAIGLAAIYREVRQKVRKTVTVDMTGMREVKIVDGARSTTRIIHMPELGQTLVHVMDEADNQVDVTLGSSVMATSRMLSKQGSIYYYFDRDGDGMPELRSRKNPTTRESVFERLAAPQWVPSASESK